MCTAIWLALFPTNNTAIHALKMNDKLFKQLIENKGSTNKPTFYGNPYSFVLVLRKRGKEHSHPHSLSTRNTISQNNNKRFNSTIRSIFFSYLVGEMLNHWTRVPISMKSHSFIRQTLSIISDTCLPACPLYLQIVPSLKCVFQLTERRKKHYGDHTICFLIPLISFQSLLLARYLVIAFGVAHHHNDNNEQQQQQQKKPTTMIRCPSNLKDVRTLN